MTHRRIVAGDFLNCRRDVFDYAAVAWSVICSHEVVVDCLWNTNHAQVIATLLSELGDLVGSVLGVVTARVEEIANVVSFEYLKYCLLYTSPSPRDQRGSRMPSSA